MGSSQIIPIVSDLRLCEAIEPIRHWVTVRYPDKTTGIVEVWSIDASTMAVFSLIQQWRAELGCVELVGLQRVPEVEAA